MGNQRVLTRSDLVHPDLSYEIIGCAYEVCNVLGAGRQEKEYPKALAKEFNLKGLKFKEQVYCPLEYNGEIIGKFY